jgi:hypothetical protein
MELGDLTLGDGEQADTGEAQPLEQAGDVFLIARRPGFWRSRYRLVKGVLLK